jgi:hypothetical protein
MKTLFGLCGLLILGALGVSVWPAQAQRPVFTSAMTQAAVPISKIVLYTSGVGYFQRDGAVHDTAEVALRFKTDHIKDLLKSLVVQDLDGGRVTTVVYEARDPLTRTLKSFPIDLTANPGLGELLQQIRGASLEIATPAPVRGVVLGVEKKSERVGERETVELEYLNLLTDSGLRTFPLHQLQRIALLNGRLEAELRRALDTLAAHVDTEKKTVRVVFDGTGQRRVRVAYIAEMPVWKTTYRLVLRDCVGGGCHQAPFLSDTAPPLLQGWAIVENTTDEDWQNVQLSLVSGRPLAFVMDLYEPLYVERPVVEPELYTALRPPVHTQALEAPPAPKAHRPEEKREAQADMSAAGRALAAPGMAPATEQPALDIQQGVVAMAQAAERGELFEYTISSPVSLARQTSALLPIFNATVAGEKLSIYNERVHARHPLNGFRLRNSSALHLRQGPLTVFDSGGYAGDARMADLPPGQEQLISYALDLQAEVQAVPTAEAQELVSVSVRRGTLLATRKQIAEKTYTVKNRHRQQKVVLVEHPWRADWQLTMPDQPVERTRDVYRFVVTVAPEQTARLQVREEKPVQQTVRLMDAGSDLLVYLLQARQLGNAVRAALQKVVELRDRLEQTRAQRSRLEQQISDIFQEQTRIRQNMAQLAQNSELYQRYVRKFDQQESTIETLRQEIDSLKNAEDRQRLELHDYLLGLDIE